MGEISESMLDGTLCECCGDFLGGYAAGFPVRCEGCEETPRKRPPLGTPIPGFPRTSSGLAAIAKEIAAETTEFTLPAFRAGKLYQCPFCKLRFKRLGRLRQHCRDRHKDKYHD